MLEKCQVVFALNDPMFRVYLQKGCKFHILDLFVITRDKLVLIRPPSKLILFIIHHAILSSVNKTPHNSFRSRHTWPFYKNNLIASLIFCINIIYSCDSLK